MTSPVEGALEEAMAAVFEWLPSQPPQYASARQALDNYRVLLIAAARSGHEEPCNELQGDGTPCIIRHLDEEGDDSAPHLNHTSAAVLLDDYADVDKWAARSGHDGLRDEQGKEIVVMSQETIDKLDDYSMTMPTGVYFGKRWKRQRRNSKGLLPGWMLCSYDFDPGDAKSAITTPRRIMTPEEFAASALSPEA